MAAVQTAYLRSRRRGLDLILSTEAGSAESFALQTELAYDNFSLKKTVRPDSGGAQPEESWIYRFLALLIRVLGHPSLVGTRSY